MSSGAGPLVGLRAAVVGGSIGGLAAATALHRLGATVCVYEKSASMGTGGSLGFCHVPLWEHLRGARMLRRGVQASRAQGAFLYKDLWKFWFDALPAGTIQFGTEIRDLGDPNSPAVAGESYDVVVVADGGWSVLRAKYFDPAQPRYAGFEVWRFRVDLDAVRDSFVEVGVV
jgi:2-polyprenyl-6-methoxyphenol hydroxylase-like FAD-dependent oxidoreductase